MVEIRIVPEGRSSISSAAEKQSVFEIRDLASREVEIIYPDAVNGLLVFLALLRSHQKPSCGNQSEFRLVRSIWLIGDWGLCNHLRRGVAQQVLRLSSLATACLS
jgi:hypothetical protein